jgi:hypothetical protein
MNRFPSAIDACNDCVCWPGRAPEQEQHILYNAALAQGVLSSIEPRSMVGCVLPSHVGRLAEKEGFDASAVDGNGTHTRDNPDRPQGG